MSIDQFARLETHAGQLVLAELTLADDEFRLRIRRDREITCEMKLGPWPDTDEGYAAAQNAIDKLDMAEAARILDAMIADLLSKGNAA